MSINNSSKPKNVQNLNFTSKKKKPFVIIYSLHITPLQNKKKVINLFCFDIYIFKKLNLERKFVYSLRHHNPKYISLYKVTYVGFI